MIRSGATGLDIKNYSLPLYDLLAPDVGFEPTTIWLTARPPHLGQFSGMIVCSGGKGWIHTNITGISPLH